MTHFSYTDEFGTVALQFAPAHALMTRPQEMPVQIPMLAESGNSYVFQRSSNVELVLTVEFLDLPEATQTVPWPTAGYQALRSFLRNTVNWGEKTFTVTDADGTANVVRYWGGFEGFAEAQGRNQRGAYWSGLIYLREVV